MKKSPKLTPWLLACFFLCAQVAWCNVIAPIAVPTPLNSNSVPQAADWNNDVQGVCNYLNANVVVPLNRLTVKGDIYACDGSTIRAVTGSTNGQVLLADSTQQDGMRWASYTGEQTVATKGDLETFNGSAITAVPIGADNTILTASSAQSNGFNWQLFGSGYPSGAIVAWSPTGAGTTTIPSGWLVCDGTSGTPNLIGLFVLGTRPNGSSASPAAGGYGAHTADTQNGSSTHLHSGLTRTISTDVNQGNQLVKSGSAGNVGGFNHAHLSVTVTAGCQSKTSEPSDFALIYLIKS